MRILRALLAIGYLVALARRSLVALVLHAVLTGAGVALVLQAGVVSREQLALGWLATFAGRGRVHAYEPSVTPMARGVFAVR